MQGAATEEKQNVVVTSLLETCLSLYIKGQGYKITEKDKYALDSLIRNNLSFFAGLKSTGELDRIRTPGFKEFMIKTIDSLKMAAEEVEDEDESQTIKRKPGKGGDCKVM